MKYEVSDGTTFLHGQPNPDAPPLAYLDVGAWQGQPVPRQRWLSEARIPDENVTLLGGDGATGKTTIALQLCIATVLGLDWLGTIIQEPGPAIFFTGEESADEVHRRLARILTAAGHQFKDIANKFFAHCHVDSDPSLGILDRAGNIQPTELFYSLERAALRIKPKVIVIEAVADVFGGDEIKRLHVRQFVGLLRALAIRCKTAVVLLYHPSQSGMNSGSGAAGSTHWNNSCRSRLYFSIVKAPKPKDGEPEAEADTGARRLEVMKSNYGPRGEVIKLRWRDGVFAMDDGAAQLDKAAAANKLARDAEIDDLFLALLERMNRQQRWLSNGSRAPNYAPAELAQHPDAHAKGFIEKDLATSMRRLLNAERVHVTTVKGKARLMPGARPTEKPRACDQCGQPMGPEARSDAKFCSDSCRQQARRDRVTDNGCERVQAQAPTA